LVGHGGLALGLSTKTGTKRDNTKISSQLGMGEPFVLREDKDVEVLGFPLGTTSAATKLLILG